MTKTEIQALLDRVEEATGADRELDAAIGSTVRYHPYGPFHWLDKSPEAVYAPTHDGWMGFTLPGEELPRDAWASPEYTASIDVALALTKRLLAGWKWNVGMDSLDEVHATVWHGITEEDHYAATAPLAIIAATLSAFIEVQP